MSVPRIFGASDVGPAMGAGEVSMADPIVTPGEATGPDFVGILEHQVADASRLQQLASAKSEALARGATDDLHGTMISVKEAEISMKLVGSIRNRLLDAFHELWRINL